MTQKLINKDAERILFHYIGVLIACADECEKIVPEAVPKIEMILDELIAKIKLNRKRSRH